MSPLYSKTVRRLNPIGYALIVTGVVMYMMRDDFSKFLYFEPQIVFMASIGTMGYGAAVLLLNYLKGARLNSADEGLLRDEIRVIRNELAHRGGSKSEIERLKKRIDEVQGIIIELRSVDGAISADDRDKIVSILKEDVLKNASDDLVGEFENRYSEDTKLSAQVRSIKEQLENTRLRLREEINSLGRRGNVNLVIGVLTTLAAVSILTTTVIDPEFSLTNETLVTQYAPRLTLSLFIEIFSFFFLKLYKSGLSEIKYFQNELTNIEMKYVSLDTALRAGDSESVSGVVSEFSRTERNFVLEKGQSTVEIERSRIDHQGANDALGHLKGIIDKIRR